jgi:uncharacterized protein YggL (DUF469 family)
MSAPCPVFGFVVAIGLARPHVAGARDAFTSAIERDVFDPHGLAWRRTDTPSGCEFTVRSEASQATAADRDATHAWLAARGDLQSFHIGPIVDLSSAA